MLLYLFCNKSHYENVPFEIPENWCWVTGNDIFNAMISCKPQGDEFKYIDIDSIDNKNHRIISPKILKVKNAPSRASRYTQPGDVLFSMVRPYLKNIALVEEGSCIASTGFFVCSPMQLLTSEYCYYMMLSDYVVYGLNQYMKGDNSPSINNGHITSWLYPIPPINEQLRITTEIKKWFVFIDDLESGEIELESLIKQVKSKILDLAITGKLVPQDPNDEPAIELLKRINPDFQPCDNSHYENMAIPQSWELVSLNSVVDIISGVSYAKSDIKESGVRILRGGNIQDGEIICLEDDVFIDQSYSNMVNSVVKGDIVLVASTGSPTLIGKTGYARITYPDTQIGAFLRIIRPKSSEISAFLNLIFNSDFYKNYIRSLAKGTNINNVKNGYIEQFEIALPPIQEQERIVMMVENIFISLDNITAGLL